VVFTSRPVFIVSCRSRQT